MHLRLSEQVSNVIRINGDGRLVLHGDFRNDLANELSELTLKPAHSGFIRVRVDDGIECFVGHGELIVLKPCCASPPREEMLCCDSHLLSVGVAVKPDHLGTVEKGSGD